MRLSTIATGPATIDTPAITLLEATGASAPYSSAAPVGFDVRFSPSAPGPLRFLGDLKFGMCDDKQCLIERVELAWTLQAGDAPTGAKVRVSAAFTRQPTPGASPLEASRRGHVWMTLVPAASYPADDTCLMNDLIPPSGSTCVGGRDRGDLRRHTARASESPVDFCVAPGDYYLLALRAGDGWRGSRSVRRKLTVTENDTVVELTAADETHDCSSPGSTKTARTPAFARSPR